MDKCKKRSDLSKMYPLMLDGASEKYIKYLKFLAYMRQLLRIPRCRVETAEYMIIRFLRKEMGLSAYGDLFSELSTRICNTSQNEVIQHDSKRLPEYKRAPYDVVNNVITLDKGTKIYLDTGVIQSGVEKYMKCVILDKIECETLKTIRLERLVRDEQRLRDKYKNGTKKKARTKKSIETATDEVVDIQILMDDVINSAVQKSK